MKYLYVIRGFLISTFFTDVKYRDINPKREPGPVFWRRYAIDGLHSWYGKVGYKLELKKFSYEYVGRWFIDSSLDDWG